MRDARALRRRWGSPTAAPRSRIASTIVALALVAGATPVDAQDTTTTTAPPTTTTAPPTTTTAPPTTTTVAPTTSTTTTPPSTSAPAATTTAPGATPTTTVPGATTTTTVAAAPVEEELDETALDEEELAALRELQHQYDELVADEAEALAEYTIRLTRVEELDAELAALDLDIAVTERRLQRANDALAAIEREQRRNQAATDLTAKELAHERDRLRRQAIDTFIVGGSSSGRALEVVLDANSKHTVEVAMTYATMIVEAQSKTIDEVRRLEAELAERGLEIAQRRAEAEAAHRKVVRLEAALQTQRSALSEERDRAEAERAQLDRALAVIRSRKAEYDNRLEVMAIESDNISTVLARAQRDQEQADFVPLLRAPIDPTSVSSGFGPRIHPIFGTMRRHNGLDISGSLGDPIRAVDDGVVVMAEARNGFGNTIVIDHGGKVASLYAHQSRFEVEVGDQVLRGQLIGRVGSTGWSTGPHLHLEIRVAGLPVDGRGFLVLDEPLSCDVLNTSAHFVDREVLATRDDCLSQIDGPDRG